MDMRGSKYGRGDLRGRGEWATVWTVYSPLRKGRARRWDSQPSDARQAVAGALRRLRLTAVCGPCLRHGHVPEMPVKRLSRRVFTAAA
jgi:hypothetical protein